MPEITDVTPVAPSATETPNPYASGKLTKEISKQWAKGETVQPKKEVTATSDTQEETAHAETAAEPAAAKEAQEKGSRRKPGAEERIAELVAENKRLKESAKPAETKTEAATVKAEPPKKLEAPKRPRMEDFDTLEAHDVAMDKYLDERDAYNIAKAKEEFKRDSQNEAAQAKFNEYLDDATKRYPNLKEVLPPFTKELETVHPYVQQFLNTATDNIADVLMVICQDEAAKSEFLTEAKADPAKAIKRIALTEKLVKEELAKGKTEAKETKESKAEEKPEKEPPAKTETKEQPQATREVGNRGTGPADPTADAVRRANGKLTKEVSDRWMRQAAERHQN